MYLRGGDYDQVAVLFEGAPVFGPYHMFGMFGLFNADAVESVELYKGAIPARYGGALSGVLSARQRVGDSSGPRFSGGLSMLGLRLAAVGSAPWADVQWMAAGRRATISLSTLPTPYSFHDLNLGIRLHPGEEHRVSFSLLATHDDFGWGLGLFGDSFDSNWSNLVSSATWSWVRGNGLTSDVTAYASRYDATLGVGTDGTGPATTNRVGAVGLRSQLTIRGNSRGARAGFAAEGGSVSLRGTAPGAYIAGDAESPYLHGFVFAELEQWIGPLRLGPGLRAGTRRGASRAFLEPRMSARLYLGPFAASVDYGNGRIMNLSYDGDLVGEVGYDLRMGLIFGVAVLESGLYVMNTPASVPWVLVDREGKTVESVDLPLGFEGLSMRQRTGSVAHWKEDRWVFGFQIGNGWFTFRREVPDLASPYVEHTDLPPRDAPMTGDPTFSAISLSVRGDTLAVLFGGNTRLKLHWIDLYDLNTGTYLKSLFLPQPARHAVMGPQGQVFLVTYDLYPTVMAIRPRADAIRPSPPDRQIHDLPEPPHRVPSTRRLREN